MADNIFHNPSAMMVSAILAVGLGVIVIVYQYLKRRTLNSGAAAVLGMCLVIANLNFWSWDLLKPGDSLSARVWIRSESCKTDCPKGRGVGLL